MGLNWDGTADEGHAYVADYAYAIETWPGVTAIFAPPETLSRMCVLYQECSVEYQPNMMQKTIKGSLTFQVAALIINHPLKELEFVHQAMAYLKGYPIAVWGWTLDSRWDNEPYWHGVNIRAGDCPVLLTISHDEPDMMYFFGQPSTLELALSFCKEMDGGILTESRSNGYLEAFVISRAEGSKVEDRMKKIKTPIISRKWEAPKE